MQTPKNNLKKKVYGAHYVNIIIKMILWKSENYQTDQWYRTKNPERVSVFTNLFPDKEDYCALRTLVLLGQLVNYTGKI